MDPITLAITTALAKLYLIFFSEKEILVLHLLAEED
jgi:hypothetical protein